MKSPVNDRSVVLSDALWAQVQAAAADDHGTVEDVVRSPLEQGLNARRWDLHAVGERSGARSIGLLDDDVALADDYV